MIPPKFWAVWKENGASPTMRHETAAAAKAEAERLAKKYNERFYVLETIGIMAPAELPVTWTPV